MKIEQTPLYVSFENLKNLYNEFLRLPKRHLLIALAKQSISLDRDNPEKTIRILSYLSGYNIAKTCDALEDLYRINHRWSFNEMPEGCSEVFPNDREDDDLEPKE